MLYLIETQEHLCDNDLHNDLFHRTKKNFTSSSANIIRAKPLCEGRNHAISHPKKKFLFDGKIFVMSKPGDVKYSEDTL